MSPEKRVRVLSVRVRCDPGQTFSENYGTRGYFSRHLFTTCWQEQKEREREEAREIDGEGEREETDGFEL